MLRVEGSMGATSSQLVMAQQAFVSFCAMARTSASSNPSLVGRLSDGAMYRITRVGISTTMQLWTDQAYGAKAKSGDIYGVCGPEPEYNWTLPPEINYKRFNSYETTDIVREWVETYEKHGRIYTAFHTLAKRVIVLEYIDSYEEREEISSYTGTEEYIRTTSDTGPVGGEFIYINWPRDLSVPQNGIYTMNGAGDEEPQFQVGTDQYHAAVRAHNEREAAKYDAWAIEYQEMYREFEEKFKKWVECRASK